MSQEDAHPIGIIDVIPGAGSTLNRGSTWKDVIDVDDSHSELADFVSVVSAEEMASFLREEHHTARGRPWALGRYYDAYLIERGVGAKDRVLDFGCGAGRIGARLAARLPNRGYVGVDSHLLSLKAFASYEIPMRGLENKEPALIWGGVESLRFFQSDYSVVLDLFTSLHMPDDLRRRYFDEIRRLLRPGGRLIGLATGSDVAQDALASGFKIAHKQVQELPLLWPLGRKKRLNSWIEYSVSES